MDLNLSNSLMAADPRIIDHIVGQVKSQGIFDQFRKECIADVDTKVLSFILTKTNLQQTITNNTSDHNKNINLGSKLSVFIL